MGISLAAHATATGERGPAAERHQPTHSAHSRARARHACLSVRARRTAQALGANENVARNGYGQEEPHRFGAQQEQGGYVESDYHRQQIDKAAMGASGTQKHVAKGKSGANDEWGDDELGDDLLPM